MMMKNFNRIYFDVSFQILNKFYRNLHFTKIFLKNLNKETIYEDNNLEHLSPKKLLESASSLDVKERSPEDLLNNSSMKHENISDLSDPHNATSVILFPGQGTQFIGMGKCLLDYPKVKEMYDKASEILGYDLLKLCLTGPNDILDQTKYQQAAIFVTSLAAIEKIRCDQPEVLESCEATAGFSIGEIVALTFAGSFTFENAVKLVKIRGEAMQIASELNRGGMITVFFRPDSKLKFACSIAKEYCQKLGIEDVDCAVANYLYPHCKVIAGNEEALQFIQKHKDDFNLKRIKRINVSGAFHTQLMKPAAFAFSEVLKNTKIFKPRIPVFSNVSGLPYKNATHILHQLPKQIYRPVLWEQTLHRLYDDNEQITRTIECGPGKSLSSVLKMVHAKAWMQCSNIDV